MVAAGAFAFGSDAGAAALAVVSVPCAGGFTGALALSEAAPAGLFVVAAGALALFGSVADAVELAGTAELAEAVGVWSAGVLGMLEAGGFTGALALSEAAPAGLLVVAAGAFALASAAGAAAPMFDA